MINIVYRINATHNAGSGYALIDRGANGGVLGSAIRILTYTNRSITLTGIDNHQLPNLPICTGAAVTYTCTGPIILIFSSVCILGAWKNNSCIRTIGIIW
jgi:hypothetical protein